MVTERVQDIEQWPVTDDIEHSVDGEEVRVDPMDRTSVALPTNDDPRAFHQGLVMKADRAAGSHDDDVTAAAIALLQGAPVFKGHDVSKRASGPAVWNLSELRRNHRNILVSRESEVDEPLPIDAMRHLLEKLASEAVVLDQVVVRRNDCCDFALDG